MPKALSDGNNHMFLFEISWSLLTVIFSKSVLVISKKSFSFSFKFLSISSSLKSPQQDPTLIWSELFLFGINIFLSSSKVSLLPDWVYKWTAGVHPPATPKQSHEIEILFPVTEVPSFDSFIIETLFNLL